MSDLIGHGALTDRPRATGCSHGSLSLDAASRLRGDAAGVPGDAALPGFGADVFANTVGFRALYPPHLPGRPVPAGESGGLPRPCKAGALSFVSWGVVMILGSCKFLLG